MSYTKVRTSIKPSLTRTNQRGIVSLMVTLIMIFVISLLVIAFAQLTRRNQREALDRQQSSQAYYAAETGVNDAVTYLNSHRTATIDTTGTCPLFNSMRLMTPRVTIGGGASYSCLTVNNMPKQLTKSSLLQDDSLVWPLKTASNITSLTVSWTAPTGVIAPTCTSSRSTSNLPKSTIGSWNCDYGMLRFDLYDASTGGISTSAMAASTKSYYLLPKRNGAPGSVGSGMRANIGKAKCVSGLCTATVNLPTPASSNNYFIHMSMLYHDAGQITVAANDTTGPQPLSGAQAIIDSTGRSLDQLRRIQVRVPLIGTSSGVSSYAAQGDICKQITAYSGYYDLGGTCTE